MNGLIREEIVYCYTSNFLFNIHQYINIYLYSNIPRPLQEYFIIWCKKRFRTIKENFQNEFTVLYRMSNKCQEKEI